MGNSATLLGLELTSLPNPQRFPRWSAVDLKPREDFHARFSDQNLVPKMIHGLL